MLLFKLRKEMFEADTGANGGEGQQTDPGATEPNGAEPQGADTLETIMNGADNGKTQPKPESDNGSSNADNPGDASNDMPAWVSQLPTEMRTDDLKQFSKISDVVSAYQELAKKSNEPSQALDPNAKPEEIQAFYEKLGKPKTADGYTFENLDGNEDGFKLFKEAAFKANLTDSQAKSVYETFADIAKSQIEAQKAAIKASYTETEKALQSEYGDKYGEKLTLLKRGMNDYATPELKAKLNQYGMTFDKDLVKLFITLGEASAEAGTTQRGTNSNGYKSLDEGGLFDFKDLDK